MLTTLPFKIIVDSRNAVTGTANNFSISLPETLHIDKDVAMYVNSASVTNTFFTGWHPHWTKEPLLLLVLATGKR